MREHTGRKKKKKRRKTNEKILGTRSCSSDGTGHGSMPLPHPQILLPHPQKPPKILLLPPLKNKK